MTTTTSTEEFIFNRYFSEYSTVLIADEIKKKVNEMAEEIANKIIENYKVKDMIIKKGTILGKGQIALVITLKPKKNNKL